MDLLLSNVAQAAFLAATLGEDAVSLCREGARDEQIRIIHPALVGSERYDLIVNVDSLPEMDNEAIGRYAGFISRSCETFLSVNHEAHEKRIADLFSGATFRWRTSY